MQTSAQSNTLSSELWFYLLWFYLDKGKACSVRFLSAGKPWVPSSPSCRSGGIGRRAGFRDQ